jgi:hypothetical protein
MMEALLSSETSVLTRAKRRNIPENGIPPFLTSAMDEDERSASHHIRFTPEESARGIHGIEGWMVIEASLDAYKKLRRGTLWPSLS